MASDTPEEQEVNVAGRRQAVVVNDGRDDAVGQQSSVTIMDLFMAVRKHWLTAVVVFVIVFAAMAGYTFSQTKMYTATAQLFASYNNATSETDSSTGADSTSNYTQVGTQSVAGTYIANQLKSYPDLVKTSAVLKPVVGTQDGGNLSVGALSGMVSAENPENTYMLNLSVVNSDPQLAATLANEIAKSLSNVVESELYSSGSKSIVKLSIVQEATVPAAPSSPNVTMNLAAGAALGIIMAFAGAVLRNLLSRRVQDISDLQAIAQHATVVGVIPKDDDLDGTKPIVVTKPDGSIAEEFRRIRTNLSFTTSKDGDKGRLIVVTSSMPSEGKTTISCNLAATLAENGAAVLLIDADLRHPSVAKQLGLEGNVGLAHVLSNQATVKDVVQRYWKPNLHILPAGPRIQNASVLLNSAIMRNLIKQAVQQYDYVIIDTTPMSVANDAAVFGQQGNGVVLVSGKGVTFKSALRGTVTELGELDVPVLGFVFNLADQQKSGSYGSYYYYGSYYHYGEYGYGSEDDADSGKQSRKKPAGKRGRK